MHLRTESLYFETTSRKYRKIYREFMVSETNAKLAEKKDINARIKYIHSDDRLVTNVEEMHKFIRQNPQETMIGFILCYPAFDENNERFAHVTPILYVRDEVQTNGHKKDMHSFIMFDSVLQGMLIPSMPDVFYPNEQQHFYFMLKRQSSGRACFEDAIRSLPILMSLVRTCNLINYCEKNAEVDFNIIKLMTKSEIDELKTLWKTKGKHSAEDKIRRTWLEQKSSFTQQLLSRRKFSERYLGVVDIIRGLPSELLPTVEHFSTMRMLRSVYPDVFLEKKGEKSALEILLQTGQKACPQGEEYTLEEFKANMRTQDKTYDFSGEEFDMLLNRTAGYVQNRSCHVFNLFHKKLNTFSDTKFKDKKSDAELIATKIAKFSGIG